MAPKLTKLDRETIGLKWFALFTVLGWALMGFSILVGAIILAPTAASYWGEATKAARDAATVGSGLLGQLITLGWWPKLLLPLTFLGVASFILGISMQFSAIPGILDRRIEVLKRALPLMGENN